MTLKIDDDQITSPDTRHQAKRVTKTTWLVTWLRDDHRLTRNQAITAMIIASTVDATEHAGAFDHQGHPVTRRDPLWLHIISWAAELGLDGAHAILQVRQAPKWKV